MSRKNKGEDPDQCAGNVVKNEPPIGHVAHAGDERRECAYDRHEPRDDNGLSAIFMEETFGFLQMIHVKKADIFVTEDPGRQIPADRIIDGVAQYRGSGKQKKREPEV